MQIRLSRVCEFSRPVTPTSSLGNVYGPFPTRPTAPSAYRTTGVIPEPRRCPVIVSGTPVDPAGLSATAGARERRQSLILSPARFPTAESSYVYLGHTTSMPHHGGTIFDQDDRKSNSVLRSVIMLSRKSLRAFLVLPSFSTGLYLCSHQRATLPASQDGRRSCPCPRIDDRLSEMRFVLGASCCKPPTVPSATEAEGGAAGPSDGWNEGRRQSRFSCKDPLTASTNSLAARETFSVGMQHDPWTFLPRGRIARHYQSPTKG